MEMIGRPEQAPSVPQVSVHIDRILLVGINPRDRAAVSAAVESEMTRLFTEREWTDQPSASATTEKLDAGVLRHSDVTRDGELGAKIGSAVYRGITR
jgi:hypothetical protein